MFTYFVLNVILIFFIFICVSYEIFKIIGIFINYLVLKEGKVFLRNVIIFFMVMFFFFYFERCFYILKYFIYILYLLNFVCVICILRRESVGMIIVMNFKYNFVVNNDFIKISLLFIMYVCML